MIRAFELGCWMRLQAFFELQVVSWQKSVWRCLRVLRTIVSGSFFRVPMFQPFFSKHLARLQMQGNDAGFRFAVQRSGIRHYDLTLPNAGYLAGSSIIIKARVKQSPQAVPRCIVCFVTSRIDGSPRDSRKLLCGILASCNVLNGNHRYDDHHNPLSV